MEHSGVIAVLGATGRQGGAVARHLLADGRRVRALTRTPTSAASDALRTAGAEVAQCDMADPDSLLEVFAGAYGVYSVQNPMIAGHEGEVRQGKNVADAARATGVQHVVYGSAGPGLRGTGVDSWEAKLLVADYLRSQDVPLTVLRPMAFMELMTDKDFYPPVSTWHLMPKLAGEHTLIPWVAADDLGAIAARVFAEPAGYVGAELPLAAEYRSIDELRRAWSAVKGRSPRGFPMPVRLFERFVGKDLTTMWRWLATNPVSADPTATAKILGRVTTVEEFLA
ncbi:NmrA/HSCARG family protein [Kribbella turkmenica]|uniref:NmrA/HSCARG family protein n=1 Tax=Kribbella turkmenica TaxID=2530375 RepID=A0A4R4XHA8_9ACTN|nr:NmrA/HSCARG family protein [Kribbella turkmenica]TDD30029.1 NmrA/HSCARG family protein [Kribbella turkmenica]